MLGGTLSRDFRGGTSITITLPLALPIRELTQDTESGDK